jgi:4-diphosphocytidyl-2-C-methyl-D-erythritol kinase
MSVEIKAYAKINLVLNVIAKREDGFHEVDFLMTNVNIFDTVNLSIADSDEVVCKKAPFIAKEKNLAYKAWLLMKEKYNLPGAIKIDIDKVIPVSAGMAGGSADCAATIKGINQLFKLNLTYKQMALIGAELGSDVPFCIYSHLSRAKGRGEEITLIDKKLPITYMVIINPGVGLSTPKVFKNHVIEKSMTNVDDAIEKIQDFTSLCNYVTNDLEKTAMKLEPKIGEIKNYISDKFDNKMLVSGSGPTVIVFCETKKNMFDVYNYGRERYRNIHYTEMR